MKRIIICLSAAFALLYAASCSKAPVDDQTAAAQALAQRVVGKQASRIEFRTAASEEKDFFTLAPAEIAAFRPCETYYGGRAYHKKKGSTGELLKLFLKPAHKI